MNKYLVARAWALAIIGGAVAISFVTGMSSSGSRGAYNSTYCSYFSHIEC